MFRALIALLLLPLLTATTPPPQCITTVGGPFRIDSGGRIDNTGITFIDVSHPAPALYAYPSIRFAYRFSSNQPVAMLFATVRAEGQTYRIIDQSHVDFFFPTTGVPLGTLEVREMVFDHPLVFDKGDMFAVISRAPGGVQGLPVYGSTSPQGILVSNSDLGTAGTLDVSKFRSIRAASFGAALQTTIPCAQLPVPELFIPVVGDIQGLAHYSTEVSVFTGPLPRAEVIDWAIRDRTRNPNAPSLITGSTPMSSFTATVDGLPASYVGTMTLAFPFYALRQQEAETPNLSDEVTATARITARIPLGETGSSINAVSCEKIGHTIAVPFHVTPGHRVNIGIASAQLNSCGIFRPATSVVATVNGVSRAIAMPAESIQLDNITAEGSPLPDAIGLTDGVVTFTVTDEASRIVAYSSLLDNTSQSATLTYGTVIR